MHFKVNNTHFFTKWLIETYTHCPGMIFDYNVLLPVNLSVIALKSMRLQVPKRESCSESTPSTMQTCF